MKCIRKRGNELVIPIKATNDSFVFESGKKHIQVAWDEVVFFHSSGGIVSVYLANQRYTTHFSSLNEMIDKMPPDRFFRVSRQFLISRECIREIRKDVNRKLSVWIYSCNENEELSPIIISRYRSQEFLRWF
ncbi:MAG: LytTR family DNA-binding domain-containing protein [Bacteroidia bacterium]